MRNLLLYWSNNAPLGTFLLTVLVNGIYLGLSYIFMVNARKMGIDISVSAYIPVYNFTIPIRVFLVKLQAKRQAKREVLAKEESQNEAELYSDSEEIEL